MNQIYDISRYSMLTNQFDWLTFNLLLYLFSGSPVFDPTDITMADVTAANPGLVGTSQPVLGNAVTADGTAQTGPVLVPLVPIGPNVTFMVMAIATGVFATGKPVLLVDDAEGLPFTPNGLDMVIQPDWAQARGWYRP